MRIGIIGAGGVGAYVGGRLAAAGNDVCFLARGEHLDAMLRDGLTVEGSAGTTHIGKVHASDNPANLGPVDVAIFTVKLWDTETVTRAIAPMVGASTVVVTLQNGVQGGDMIRRVLTSGRVASGAMVITSHISRPGVVTCRSEATRMMIEGRGDDPQLRALVNACALSVGLQCDLMDDGGNFLWQKFVTLTAYAGSTALVRRPLGEIRDNPETSTLLHDLIHEAALVSEVEQPSLPAGKSEEVASKVIANWAGDTFASMAIDLLRGKPLELEWLSGHVHRLGQKHGIPTPAHTNVYRALVLYSNGNQRGTSAP